MLREHRVRQIYLLIDKIDIRFGLQQLLHDLCIVLFTGRWCPACTGRLRKRWD